MTNILLLGGSGFIGSNIASYFINKNFNIIILDMECANFSNLTDIENITIYKGSIGDEGLLKTIFTENLIDIVINLVTTILPGNELLNVENDISNNLFLMIRLLDVMNEFNVNKIIFFSSGGTVYGKSTDGLNSETHETEPINLYGWIKLSIEKYIQMYSNLNKMNYLIVRPSNPYGRHQNIFGKQGIIAVALGRIIKNEPLIIWGDGKIIRDYIYIDDLCNALYLLIKNEKWNQVYNIGSGIGVSINELLTIIKEVTRKSITIDYQKPRNVDVEINILDISKLKLDVDFHISTDIFTGITSMWSMLQQGVSNELK